MQTVVLVLRVFRACRIVVATVVVHGQKIIIGTLAKREVGFGRVGTIIVVKCAGTDVFVRQTLH
jgi:hypothetical protein